MTGANQHLLCAGKVPDAPGPCWASSPRQTGGRGRRCIRSPLWPAVLESSIRSARRACHRVLEGRSRGSGPKTSGDGGVGVSGPAGKLAAEPSLSPSPPPLSPSKSQRPSPPPPSPLAGPRGSPGCLRTKGRGDSARHGSGTAEPPGSPGNESLVIGQD